MKRQTAISIILLFLLHYIGYGQNFDVSIDTLNLRVKDKVKPATRLSLTHAIKYGNKYYCFFLGNGLYYFSPDKKYFFVISNDGTIENNIIVPDEMDEAYYFDLFVRNDSILSKTYINHNSFYFDRNKLKWIKIKEVDDRIYEDDRYYITYIDFGEFGKTTWFRDKTTGKEYELSSAGTIINKIDSTYYITTDQRILMIKDPLKLKPCKPDYYYHLIEKKVYSQGSNSLIGTKIIYQDTTDTEVYSYLSKPKPYIATSFIYNNELLHVCVDSSSTFIAKLNAGKLVRIQNIGSSFPTYNCLYSFRGENQHDNFKLMKFETNNNNIFGLIEINGKQINIRYLKHDIDSLKYLKTDGFSSIFDFVRNNIDDLPLHKIDIFEKQLGGIDMQTISKGGLDKGFYPNKNNFDFEGAKTFMAVEDSVVATTSQYYYTKNDSLVRAVFLEWSETKNYKGSNVFHLKEDEMNKALRFKNKFDEIEKTVTGIIGLSPEKVIVPNKLDELRWETESGLTIKLYSSDFKNIRQIRMIIYKK